jgi:exopolysaccharide production protein ExoQ
MVTTNASKFSLWIALGAVPLVAAASLLFIVRGPTTSSLALIAAFLAPVALYVALEYPLIFPLTVYVLLIPFDSLLGTGSGTLTRLLGMVSGAFLLIAVLRRRTVAITPPIAVLAALTIWMLASSLWAVDQKAALAILPTYVGLFLLFAVLTMTPISIRQFRWLLALTAAGGLCAAAYGIRMFYQNPQFAHESANTMRLIIQTGTSQIDPNHFADSLLFPIAIMMMWALRSRNLLVKLACVSGVIVLVMAILLAGSREGIVAIALIMAYYVWRSRYRLQVLIAGLVIGSGVMTSPTSVWLRFTEAAQTGGSGRTSIWGVGFEAAKHRLLQGYGIGNFTHAFDMFYLAIPAIDAYGWDSPAHNLILHYLVELGIVGLALIALLFVAQFRSLREIDRSSDLYDYRVALEASLLAILTVSMTIDLFTYKYAWWVFTMVALLSKLAETSHASAPMRDVSSDIMSARSARSAMRSLPELPNWRSETLSKSAR